MMTPFLKQVADHYYNKGDVSGRCFVFPNRRSMAFFRKYLTEVVRDRGSAPVIEPRMVTVNDFFFKVSGMVQADRVTQLLCLYDCYKALNPKAESLDEFVFWGDVILADFNDVDKYFVDPSQLFANVSDYKQIQDTYTYLTDTQRKAIEGFVSHFSDLSGKLTVNLDTENPDVKGRFLLIWNLLHRLYIAFNESLAAQGLAYEGMVYRSLAQRLKDNAVEDVFKGVFPDDMTFVFVGLNALNECEKILLRKLRDCSRAEFCWDYSGELIRDPQNRSSVFMSENVAEFKQAAKWDEHGVGLPNVNVVSVPSAVGQAKRLPDVLSGICSGAGALNGDCGCQGCMDSSALVHKDMSDTAVILPDEAMLLSVLNAIPEDIADINVTMGLPMTGSLLYSMMNDIASIQLHAVNRKGEWMFYHKQVWNLFSNELFRSSVDECSAEIITSVRESAKYYISQSELSGTPLLDAVFAAVVTDPKGNGKEQIRALAEYQKNVIKTIAPRVADNSQLVLELEYAKEYYKCVNVLESHELAVMPITYIRLLSQILSSVSVPFRGEPLKGLQIMGPLEMRALDFRNLIIMSANEGVFPRRSVSSSFIPPELRKGFGLPTYEYQDSVWAYYFYRAISRAENVWMFVDSRTEGLKSGEESRYIKQLEYHFGLPVRRYVVKFDAQAAAGIPDIEKTEEDVRKICGTVLSATALQNYLACPAKFYYGTVKGLKSEDEVAESLDYGMFGTVFHDTMRALYTSESAMSPDFVFDNKGENEKSLTDMLNVVGRDYIQSWIDRPNVIKNKVKALIMGQLGVDEVSGRNLVVSDVIVKYVIKTLERDLEYLKEEGKDSFEILGREIPVFGEFCGQRFKGFIDRLDSVDPSMARVVDYKTGKVLKDDEEIDDDNAERIADSIFSQDVADRPKIALQFFIYDMLIKGYKLADGKTVYNSVYSTAGLFNEKPKTRPVNEKFYDAMSERLSGLLLEMRNPEFPFARTKDEKVCAYCDFRTICGR